jgi:hypothetical protein
MHHMKKWPVCQLGPGVLNAFKKNDICRNREKIEALRVTNGEKAIIFSQNKMGRAGKRFRL